MKNGKTYTAEAIRHTAENLEWNRTHGMEAIKIASEQVIDQLRYAAGVVERCDKAVESMHTQLMHLANEGKTTVDIGRLRKYLAHLENILRGDAGKGGAS